MFFVLRFFGTEIKNNKKIIAHVFKNIIFLVRILLAIQLTIVPRFVWASSAPVIDSDPILDRDLAMHWALVEAQMEIEMLQSIDEMEKDREDLIDWEKKKPWQVCGEKREEEKEEGKERKEEREREMREILNRYQAEREELMRSVLNEFSHEGGREKEIVKTGPEVESLEGKRVDLKKESVSTKEKEGRKDFHRIILNASDRGKEIRLQLEASIPNIIVFPEDIRQVVIVDESLVGFEKISPRELKIFSKSGLGTTIIYVWDTIGRWLFNVKVIVPKVVKKIEQSAREEKKKREVLKFSYSTDWWSFYEGRDFGSTNRTDLGHTQTLSLYGPTPYGKLNASATIEKEGDSYLTNYRFVSLDHINRWGLRDGRVVVGDYFAKGTDLTFPGTTLDGFSFSERRKNWNVIASYGETEDYWNYVPLIGQEMADITFLRLGYKDLAFNYAHRSKADLVGDEKRVSEDAYSVELDTDLWGWGISGELGHDQEKWAGLLELVGTLANWDSSILLKDVEAGYRTISGFPVHSGELGMEVSLDRSLGRNYYSIYTNIFRDREYPNPCNLDKFNVEFTAQWERRYEKGAYGISFDYDDYTGTSSPFKDYRIELQHRMNLELFKLPFVWSIMYSHSDNQDDVLGRRFFVERINNRFDWSLIPGLLNIYSSVDFGQVEERHGQKGHPRVIDTGVSVHKHSADGKKSWSFNGGYRYESHGGMPYSFSSNQDMLYLSSRLDLEFAPGRSWFVEAEAKKYYPQEETNSVRLEFYTGLRWLWNTKINLLPKVRIWGYVFEDKDLDGKKDEEEEGLPDVEVMADGRRARTDADGRYDLGWIRTEKTMVRVNGADLPLGMFPEEDAVTVTPAEGKEQRIDFPVRYVTGIRAYAFVDSNKNNKLDAGEELIEGIRLCVEDKCRYTDLQGSFAISDLSPGEHDISLDLTSLPEGVFPNFPIRMKVVLSQGQEKKVYLPLQRR